MWQVWLFIAPGLYAEREEAGGSVRRLRPALFIARRGVLALPAVSRWRGASSPASRTSYIKFTPRVEPVFEPLRQAAAGASGLVFQLPMLMFVLARFGARHGAASSSRNFKYAVLIIFVVAAVITPDGSMVPQVIMAALDGRALHHRHRASCGCSGRNVTDNDDS